MSQTQGPGDELLIPEAMATRLEIPVELLMDWGIIPDTRKHKPVPWRWRLRWRWQQARTWAAKRLYRLIAGHEPYDDDG